MSDIGMEITISRLEISRWKLSSVYGQDKINEMSPYFEAIKAQVSASIYVFDKNKMESVLI